LVFGADVCCKLKKEDLVKIEIFGSGCHRCVQVEKVVKGVVSELGFPISVEKVDDIARIVDAGILHTPGLRINGKMKCSGRIPKADDVKKWIIEERPQ